MWLGGFSGVGFSRAEFVKWLASQKKPTWAKFIAIHSTGAPYTVASVGAAKRMANLANYYKNQQHWKGGPHFFAMGSKIYPGTPVEYPSVHSPSWNNIAIAIECEGDYRKGKMSATTGAGAINWDVMAWSVAEVLKWLDLLASNTTIRFHREDTATSHRECPGDIDKDWFVGKVKEAMGSPVAPVSAPVETPKPAEKPVSPQLFDVKDIQTQLVRVGIDPGPIDGLIGPKTIAGIRKWQEKLTVEATGLLGPWAYDRLKSAPSAVSEAPSAPEQTTNTLHTSKKGLDLIKHFEGLRLSPYDDNGSLAIGYGHSNRSKKPPLVTLDLRITEQQAEDILAADLIDYENRVKATITVPLTQHQFDALVSLAYNWGPGNLDRSNLAKLVNAGKHKEAEAEIRTILPSSDKKYYAGIKRRRNQEADLYGS